MQRLYVLTFFSLLFLVCFTTSCMMYYNAPPKKLIDIPLVPHSKDIELYFNNDLPENKNYYKVLGLSVEGGSNYNELVNALKERGKRVGVDAIIHINTSQATYTHNEKNYTDQILQGIGIKYRENLDYLGQYIKAKNIYLFKDTQEPIFTYQATFNRHGEEIVPEEWDTTYTKYVRKFSFEHLLYDTKGWSYLKDTKGNVIVRRRSIPGQPFLECRYTYVNPDRINTISISSSKGTQHMQLVYDAAGNVIEKQISDRKKRLIYKEKLSYDEANRVDYTILYRIKEGAETPFIKTQYEYHSLDELPNPN